MFREKTKYRAKHYGRKNQDDKVSRKTTDNIIVDVCANFTASYY